MALHPMFRSHLCTAIVVLLSCRAVVAAQVAPTAVPTVAPTPDASVARAVAEAAAAAPDRAAQRDAVDPRPRAFDALDTSPRRCTALQAAAKVALLYGCVRSQHCAPTPVPPASQSPPASCYVYRTKADS